MTDAPTIASTQNTSAASGQHIINRTYYKFLDGLRGLAALEVLLFHLFATLRAGAKVIAAQHPDRPIQLWSSVLIYLSRYVWGFGHAAVVLFLVISGYCLILPFQVTALSDPSKTGVRDFIIRRTNRIIPPYYAAIVLSVISGYFFLGLPLDWRTIFSHFAVIQNLGLEGIRYNAAFWSIAVEWQLYFVFILLLIPFWKKFGYKPLLILSLLSGILFFSLAQRYPLSQYLPGLKRTYPALIGCFATGMCAACVKVKAASVKTWKFASVVFLIIFLFLHFLLLSHPEGDVFAILSRSWIMDYFLASAAGCLIAYYSHLASQNKTGTWLFNLLSSRAGVFLGRFSYSIYLTHLIVANLFFSILTRWQIASPMLLVFLGLLVCFPLQLLFAYGFYVVFEKPFMKR